MANVAAYELQFSREASGAANDPDAARIFKSNGVWADVSGVFCQTLERGLIPHPATGPTPVVRRIAGLTRTTVGAAQTVEGTATGAYAFVNGVVATNGGLAFIAKGGYNGYFIGAGRAGGPDFLKADGNLETALKNASTMTTATLDCFAGGGSSDNFGSTSQTDPEVMGLWQSHFGVIDFTETLTINTLQDTIYNTVKSSGSSHLLPDGTRLIDCCYAGVAPDGQIWMSATDAVSFPVSVSANTPDVFRNHPGVFVRLKGAQSLRTVVKRWQDPIAINTTGAGQPIGLTVVNDPLTISKWLLRIDGVENVFWLKHPTNSDFRAPKTIWNNIIAPLCNNNNSDGKRVVMYDRTGTAIGTDSRWQYLEAARYLGDFGNTTQSDVTPPG